jgi:hypothetical protein
VPGIRRATALWLSGNGLDQARVMRLVRRMASLSSGNGMP